MRFLNWRKSNMKKWLSVFIIVLFLAPISVYAVDPMDAIKIPIDQSLEILKDPKYQKPEMKDEQRDAMWDILIEAFDFMEISQRALAVHWRQFNDEQKKEFSEVFAKLLGKTYLDRILSEYNDEKVVYLSQDIGQDSSGQSKAIVHTKIIRDNVEIPVDYRMVEKSGEWFIYDVFVEGVSLVKNYRTQFRSLNETPKELIERVRKKAEEKKEVTEKKKTE